MTKEEFEELKKKHRNSENKAIIKAEMDYLKDTVKHQQMKTNSITGPSASSGGAASGFTGGMSWGFDVSVGTDFSGTAGGSTPAFNITV
jgi:hypothetical protein